MRLASLLLATLVLTVNCDPSQHGSGSEEDDCWTWVEMFTLLFASDCQQPIPKEDEFRCLVTGNGIVKQIKYCQDEY